MTQADGGNEFIKRQNQGLGAKVLLYLYTLKPFSLSTLEILLQ